MLEIQGGFTGYQLPPYLYLISVSLNSFINITERNEANIDGGLFSMSLLYALEYKKIAVCALNTMFSEQREVDISISFQLYRGLWTKTVEYVAYFYASQVTVGSFLYSLAIIGLILNMVESQSIKKQEKAEKTIFSRLGDCSYGIFYVHMPVLMIVSKIIISLGITENWFLYSGTRFIFTVVISYAILRIGQLLLKIIKLTHVWQAFYLL